MARKAKEPDEAPEELNPGDYPLYLYREGSEFVWDGREVDALIVNDEAEEGAGLKEGWVRSFEG